MLTVCEKHIKEAIGLLNVPHVEKMHQKYWEHNCIYCGESAKYKLFYSTPIETSLLKIKMNSTIS